MTRRTQSILLDASAGRDSLPLGLSLDQILALASIVESEAAHPEERARIARVYLNRLERHMRLQADPTVAFGEGRPPRTRLYLRDLQSPSPYNTYLHDGLPARADLQPGRSSIEGDAQPDRGARGPVLRLRAATGGTCSRRAIPSTSRTSSAPAR
jgi:cell division protein YceG involved in septum cleavage